MKNIIIDRNDQNECIPRKYPVAFISLHAEDNNFHENSFSFDFGHKQTHKVSCVQNPIDILKFKV